MLLALDIDKAFNSLKWPYLMDILRKIGFGPSFLIWVRLLYWKMTALVSVNGTNSGVFTLAKGTRQGFPLSPLLFALALARLAAWIRCDARIHGLRWDPDWSDHISLYVDDVLLYLADPERTLPRILEILEVFGTYAGVSINWWKSVAYTPMG